MKRGAREGGVFRDRSAERNIHTAPNSNPQLQTGDLTVFNP